MNPVAALSLGLAAVLAMGAVRHGPFGAGEAFVGRIEAQAQAAVAQSGAQGVSVTLGHAPRTRLATLSGPADQFQREGMGSLPGLNQIVGSIPGVSGVRWTDEPPVTAVPLIVETLAQLALAYVAGLGLGALFFGRKERQSFAEGY